MDCRASLAMTNMGHCEHSEAIQGLMLHQQCYGLPRYAGNDEHAALHSIFMRL
jgi:hypothetical protein